ncbi:MAG TPA: hypothetical protein VE033_13920 [Acetobacteraceae bacterium]|nr:hypothetical protein [Acetobacteraceae bacterium]
MFPHPDASPRIGLDCVLPLSPGRFIAFGWLATSPGVPAELVATAADGAECPIEYVGLFPRAQGEPGDATARGFALVLSACGGDLPALLSLEAGPFGTAQAAFGAPLPAHDLARVVAEQDWYTAFGLLRDTAGLPALAMLPLHGGRRHGAFAEFLARMPLLRGKTEDLAGLAAAEATCSPAGETFLALRCPGIPIGTVEAVGLDRDGEPMLPLAWRLLPLGDGIAAYGAFEAELASLVLRIGDHARWLRCEPSSLSAGPFLCRLGEALGTAALEGVLAAREASFGPHLAPVAACHHGAARTAVLVGTGDPMAVPLLHVMAATFERRFERLIALGRGAEAAVEVFRHRGRLAAAAPADGAAALREAGAVEAVHLPRFAAGLAAGASDPLGAVPMDEDAIARLLRLHAAGGTTGDLAESLACLISAAHPRPPVDRSSPKGRLIADHLERLWRCAEAPAHA